MIYENNLRTANLPRHRDTLLRLHSDGTIRSHAAPDHHITGARGHDVHGLPPAVVVLQHHAVDLWLLLLLHGDHQVLHHPVCLHVDHLVHRSRLRRLIVSCGDGCRNSAVQKSYSINYTRVHT